MIPSLRATSMPARKAQVRIENLREVFVRQAGNALQAGELVLPMRGLDADDADFGILLLEVTSDATDGPAGADAGIEGVDSALGLFPDLRSGRAIVGLNV
jgi:hypothetical protein